MFKINSLYLTDGYKVGHKAMLAPNTTRLYGTWIPRSTKHAPKGVDKIVSFGQQLAWRWLHDEFEENFFFNRVRNESRNYEMSGGIEVSKMCDKEALKAKALKFVEDMSLYLGMEYDGKHFAELWDLGYLPIKVKSLPEGFETPANVPHMTFINTVDGFAWLTLYLETIVSSLAWKPSTSATIALRYKRVMHEWVNKTDPQNAWLIDFMAHDFSARGLSPWDMVSSGLGHATSFKGSDTLAVIPAARYFYGVGENEMPIFSVNASEHSVSTTKIFTVGEKQMLSDWMTIYPTGILSVVSDTFDLWKLITEYLPALKDQILSRDGKLVIRPDSGDPVDIICGRNVTKMERVEYGGKGVQSEHKGVIELLWDIFGGTINEQGYKVLDPHIGCIYGDSITPDRQVQIYERLAAKGFAATNIVLGVGSYTYQMNTRDTLGFAAKGAWFEVKEDCVKSECTCDCVDKCLNPTVTAYNIYKDPVTDDGAKKSLKGFVCVTEDMEVLTECDVETENSGILRTIYEDGNFYNLQTLEDIRLNINKLI
jgi:nicotinamide phosphoribosyltransferase